MHIKNISSYHRDNFGSVLGNTPTGQIAEGKVTIQILAREAPPAISGENVYVAWWTNNTANSNNEVLFRASTDAGVSFGEKINLSNTLMLIEALSILIKL